MTQPITPASNLIFPAPSTIIPTLPLLALQPDESRIAQQLAVRMFSIREFLLLREMYYDGLQKMQDLGISIPPSLSRLRTVIGWPQIGLDAIDERTAVEGFRLPGETDVDDTLQGYWQANNLDSESSLAHLDTLIFGRSYIVVGPGDTDGAPPIITAESPINMTAVWDARLRKCTAALQLYLDTDYTSDMYGQEVAALYLPDKTIQMTRSASAVSGVPSNSEWEITERDNHKLGEVPVVRMANRQRLSQRDGNSEITPAWMNTTDSACRTLLGMEVGREFYAAPRRYVLGASEDAFVKPDGTAVTAWEAYMSKMFAVERNEDGDLPTVGEFKTGDPKAYTTLIDSYTKIMAGLMSCPPHFLGMISDGNPASADAIRSAEARLVQRVKRKMITFGEAWEQAMRLALLIGQGSLPAGAERMETDWTDPATPTPNATSQAITQQVAEGVIPRRSDVTLKKLGYSAIERQRIALDWKDNPAQDFLAEAAHDEEAKAIIAAGRLMKAVAQPAPDIGAPGAPAPTGPTPPPKASAA